MLWVGLPPVAKIEPGGSLSTRAEQILIILRTATDDPVPDVYVDSRKAAWDELGTILEKELRMRSQGVVWVGAQGEVRWAYVVEAVDVAKGFGAKVVLSPVAPGP